MLALAASEDWDCDLLSLKPLMLLDSSKQALLMDDMICLEYQARRTKLCSLAWPISSINWMMNTNYYSHKRYPWKRWCSLTEQIDLSRAHPVKGIHWSTITQLMLLPLMSKNRTSTDFVHNRSWVELPPNVFSQIQNTERLAWNPNKSGWLKKDCLLLLVDFTSLVLPHRPNKSNYPW